MAALTSPTIFLKNNLPVADKFLLVLIVSHVEIQTK